MFEKVEAAHGPVWYDRVPNTSTGQLMSEDLSFCLRAGALGIPVHVHTGVKVTHLKPVWLSEDDFITERVASAAREAHDCGADDAAALQEASAHV